MSLPSDSLDHTVEIEALYQSGIVAETGHHNSKIMVVPKKVSEPLEVRFDGLQIVRVENIESFNLVAEVLRPFPPHMEQRVGWRVGDDPHAPAPPLVDPLHPHLN